MARRKSNSSPISLFAFQDIITSTTGILILLALILMLTLAARSLRPKQHIEAATGQQIAALQRLTDEVKQLETRKPPTDIQDLITSTPEQLRAQLKNLKVNQTIFESDLSRRTKQLRQAQQAMKQQSIDDDTAQESARLTRQIETITKQANALKSSNRIIYNFRDVDRTPWLVQIDDRQLLAALAGTKTAKTFRSAEAFSDFARKLPTRQQYVVMVVRPSGIARYNELKESLGKLGFDLGTELIGEDEVAVAPDKGAVF